jgi:hypothetical protein
MTLLPSSTVLPSHLPTLLTMLSDVVVKFKETVTFQQFMVLYQHKQHQNDGADVISTSAKMEQEKQWKHIICE